MDRRAWLLFAVVAILWGIPYYLIKVSLHDLTPSALVFLRVLIGALVFLPLLLTSDLRPIVARWRWLLTLAFVEITVPFTLIAAGEQYISSSLTGILIATEPLAIALLALRFDPTERVVGWRLIGLLVGLGGVVALLGFGTSGSHALLGAVMILISTGCYGGGALLIRLQLSDIPSVGTVGATLVLGAVLLAIPAALNLPHHAPTLGTDLAMLILGTACTGLAFLAFFALIARAGAGRASLITYAAPAVALLLGVAGGHETVGVATFVGLGLILGGSWLASRSGQRRTTRPALAAE